MRSPLPDPAVALGNAEREILTVHAQHRTHSTMQVMALPTRRSHNSGGFRNSLPTTHQPNDLRTR